MKQYFKILSFLALLFLLTAENCGDGNPQIPREEKSVSMFQNLENEFLDDELTPENLSAFEKRAVQKLSDLADFINIYADTSLSVEFRLQAKQMITKSFKSEKDLQSYYQCFSFFADTTSDVLYYSENAASFFTEINSIIITESFQKTTNSGYSGVLQFSHTIFNLFSGDSIVSNLSQHQIEILALKTEKDFGTSSQEVWEVYFGKLK